MSLAVGQRIGPYEILAPLGTGGMGEVYRAQDDRLKRSVALKVLPDAFAHDADRVERFQREAEVLASLNHPHIGAIYDLAREGDVRFLVRELVDGDTLADRLARGPLPLALALDIARQIAQALEAAHARGIVHRDLKPANIKIGPDGNVQVLDFGLAKMRTGPAHATDSVARTALSMTGVGTIVSNARGQDPRLGRRRRAGALVARWSRVVLPGAGRKADVRACSHECGGSRNRRGHAGRAVQYPRWQGAARQTYVVSADGQRFLMNTIAEEAPRPIMMILNWRAER